ncbi:MAG: Uma2 family endonuclease [Leptospiraceae bacterium]|nr:Uma2 family endonuclease [Leptospiraceae bacterium]MDW8306882.1 hypothetical protein [Leptospiraceae bacterium]
MKTHIHGTLDLVCEVLSAASRERDLGVKAERYLKSGSRDKGINDRNAMILELWYMPQSRRIRRQMLWNSIADFCWGSW